MLTHYIYFPESLSRKTISIGKFPENSCNASVASASAHLVSARLDLMRAHLNMHDDWPYSGIREITVLIGDGRLADASLRRAVARIVLKHVCRARKTPYLSTKIDVLSDFLRIPERAIRARDRAIAELEAFLNYGREATVA